MHITAYKKCAEISRRAHYVCDPLIEAGLLKMFYENFVLFDYEKASDRYDISFCTVGDQAYRTFSFKLEGNDEWSADDECRSKEFLNSLIAYRKDIYNRAYDAAEDANRVLQLLKLDK